MGSDYIDKFITGAGVVLVEKDKVATIDLESREFLWEFEVPGKDISASHVSVSAGEDFSNQRIVITFDDINLLGGRENYLSLDVFSGEVISRNSWWWPDFDPSKRIEFVSRDYVWSFFPSQIIARPFSSEYDEWSIDIPGECTLGSADEIESNVVMSTFSATVLMECSGQKGVKMVQYNAVDGSINWRKEWEGSKVPEIYDIDMFSLVDENESNPLDLVTRRGASVDYSLYGFPGGNQSFIWEDMPRLSDYVEEPLSPREEVPEVIILDDGVYVRSTLALIAAERALEEGDFTLEELEEWNLVVSDGEGNSAIPNSVLGFNLPRPETGAFSRISFLSGND
ncbi:hypothetical protein RIF23_07625 [Lipingzhangella sp. LS1_29]|uniref:Uncharacterized protein n=1 Tax=Lipingzhangella rawalii TaxID=2055835 RepID=A0ABU2H4D8_9ACTN|nr:hypothetical protein [Lipingzhangella rawalii]